MLPNPKLMAAKVSNNPKNRFLQWQYWHIDPILLTLLGLLASTGLVILYSASNANWLIVEKQGIRMLVAFAILFCFAKIPLHYYQRWAPWVFFSITLLLIAVIFFGENIQGARRWLNFGFFHLQPSELMKLAMPMMLAYVLQDQIPPKIKTLLLAAILLALPVALTARQPDLGTATLIAISGIAVIFIAGIGWRLIFSLITLGLISLPFLWHFMHSYQKERVITFLNPEKDPLGSGYHIIQSKIAIGSGGISGKGYLQGTQSHLQFLPANTTDFIFAVGGEEFGLIGGTLIALLFFAILWRSLYISANAQSNFTRLLSSALCISFFLSAFINIGMVIGILPVVGIPLPLISYGGSSMLTTLAGFGIIMSIHTHRKLWGN